ncbi:MAG: NAD(+)/NADH kinase [Actinobacteria bacterium]|nr:NAD(+)/NADH kinase [Actinomycetota bacterium]
MRGMAVPGEITSLGLVVNTGREDATAAASAVRSWAASNGVVVVESDSSDGTAFATVDLVVSLGGDGTVLRAVQMIGDASPPVLGVNCGTLGYLTTIEPDEVIDVLDEVRRGSMPRGGAVEERMLLRVEVTTSTGVRHTLRGLNEMVVEKTESGHTVRLEVAIDDDHFATYSADGLIVATPTGSTAYSLSARGPVVAPAHRALVVTPVSPHMLFDRALVLDPRQTVRVTVRGRRGVGLAVDGLRFVELNADDVVEVTADPHVARFLRVGKRGFHQILRDKFGLGDD